MTSRRPMNAEERTTTSAASHKSAGAMALTVRGTSSSVAVRSRSGWRTTHSVSPASTKVLALPLAQREEVRGVRAEDRAVEGRHLRAGIGALARRAARAAAEALRGRHARGRGIPLAQVVFAALDELEGVAELALVLILQELLRRQEVRVAAPAREGQREMALPDAGWRLHDEDPGRLAVAPVVTDGGAELVEETHLRRARDRAGGGMGDELVAHDRTRPGFHPVVSWRRG